jgi:hypothetical protein
MLSIPIISEFDGKGIDRAVREFKQLETVGQKAQFAIKKAAIPAAAAITGIAVALGDATKAALEDAQEQAKLKVSLQNVTGASDAQVKATEDQISAMSRASGIADTDYRKALEALTRGTKDVGVAMKDMNLVMDIAQSLQMDSSTVADALAKAYQGNFKALRTLSPEMATMIKEGATLDEVMVVLGDTFGGAVAANAETAAGKLAIMKNSIGETKESIGAALLPVLEAVLPYLQKFADWAQDNPDAFLFIAGAIGLVAAAIVATNIAMALNPFSLIAIGIGLLVAGLVIAYKKFEWFSTGVKAVVNGIISVFEIWANSWIKVINAIIKGYNALPLLPDIGFIGEIKIGRIGESESPAGTGITIPKMANGGIVTQPTLAMIGERGPEAVIPLTGRNAGAGMGNTININVNGGDPNQIVLALQRYVRSNGPVPINTRAM